MAFDEGLATRLREILASRADISEKKMFGGLAMKGYVLVDPEGYEEDDDLARWVDDCIEFVDTLPPK